MIDHRNAPAPNEPPPLSRENSYAILKGIFESPENVVIFALDSHYRYLAFNRNHYTTMQKIWGVQIALGDDILDHIKSLEDREKAKANFDRALAGESFILEEEYGDTALLRKYYENSYNPILDDKGHVIGLTLFLTDITDRKKVEAERDQLIHELRDALARVKMLSGLLPMCASCKKIRNDQGNWEHIERYIKDRSEADISHSICPECARKLYPDFVED